MKCIKRDKSNGNILNIFPIEDILSIKINGFNESSSEKTVLPQF